MAHSVHLQERVLKLRELVQDCFAKHMYISAVFFADKLVSFSKEAQDVYLLAQAHYLNKQYQRALILLRRDNLPDLHLRFRYLAAKCLACCGDWDGCLALIGDGATEDFTDSDEPSSSGAEVSLAAGVRLLRGQAYEALDNRPWAILWYKAALEADPYCYDAFHALISSHMLTNREELELVDSLDFDEREQWLQLLYRCKCKKYETAPQIEEMLQALEAPEPQGGTSPLPEAHMAASSLQMGAGQPSISGREALFTHSGNKSALAPHQQQQQQQQQPQGTVGAEMGGPSGAGAGDEAPGPRGWGLQDNADVIACRADWYFHRGAYDECYRLTHRLLERDPYAVECLAVHLASAVQLGKKNELFLRAHQLVQESPKSALSWFAVGCYYMCTKQYDQARRHFCRSTTLDRSFVQAWVGYGNAFASQDESDQAMAAYRTATRLFPGLHTPLLGMGIEYQRMNNLPLADRMFAQAYAICPSDPLVVNEIGVLAFKNRNFTVAAEKFKEALQLIPGGRLTPVWEPTLCNLAHVYRKQGMFDEAILLYEQALGLQPGHPATHAALGFTQHLKGDTRAAIESYHKALGTKPGDAFTTDMLTIALEEEVTGMGEEQEHNWGAWGPQDNMHTMGFQ